MNRSFLTVSGCILLSRITGFIRDILAASHLGAGQGMDIFLIAFKLPNFFRRLFAEGAFSVAFVPHYTALLTTQGPKKALEFARHVGWALVFVLLGFIGVMEWGMEHVILLTAPGINPSYLSLTVGIARIIFPFIGWIALATFFSGILNAQENFAPAAAIGISLNAFMITVLCVDQSLDQTLHSLAWAVHLSGIIQCTFLGFLCYRRGLRLTFAWPTLSPELRQLCRKIGPAFLGGGVLQINAFIGLLLASLLPAGSISYLFYADRLIQLPLSIFGVALSTTLLPVLTKQLSAAKESIPVDALKTQDTVIKTGLMLSVPAMLGLVFFAPSIVGVLFGRGAFAMKDITATAETLRILAFGLPAYILVKIGSTIFFAHQDTRRPFMAGVLTVMVDVLLAVCLLKPFAFKGIAVATSVSYWVQTGVTVWWLMQKKFVTFTPYFYEWLKRLSMACGVMTAVLYGLKGVVQPFCLANLFAGSSFMLAWEWKRFMVLGGSILVAMCGFLVAFLIFKVVDYNDFRVFIQKCKRKNP